jgi:aconitase A
VLTVTQMLRRRAWSASFVEFFGPGLDDMTVADRATIGNMAPEYGATCGFFPIDQRTIDYLTVTGRSEERIALVDAYAKAQGMWRTAETPDPVFTDTLELDLGDVRPFHRRPEAPAGPRAPVGRQDLVRGRDGERVPQGRGDRPRHKVEGTTTISATATWCSPPSRRAPTPRTRA